jgi:hypothetical protein
MNADFQDSKYMKCIDSKKVVSALICVNLRPDKM